MTRFKLPDLGEGLQEAEILHWHVREGDWVEEDQPLVSVETAKAVVEIPSPQTGQVIHLFGQEGEHLHTGDPLVEFALTTEKPAPDVRPATSSPPGNKHPPPQSAKDNGTVVGQLAPATAAREDHFIIGAAHPRSAPNGSLAVPATPAVRALAKRLGVDLALIRGTGRQGVITVSDVERAASLDQQHGKATPLRGVRKQMAKNLVRAHAEVVPVTLWDQVDIAAWSEPEDITLRLIRAIVAGVAAEPLLNAWLDGETLSLRQHPQIDLGVAMDTEQGLFMPVLRNVAQRSPEDLRRGLDSLHQEVDSRRIPPHALQGATFCLSNFGTLAGRYATPLVVPPCVAILGAGQIFAQPWVEGGQACLRNTLPLSLTFDHRALTGGEAARFLAAAMKDLAHAK